MQQWPFKEIVLASHNEGKISELKAMVEPLGLKVLSANDLNLPEVIEDQPTFEGNATKKAVEISKATNLPALADDSGLCVDALDGKPGVLTARYSRTYERLMTEISEVPTHERGAHFVCVLAFAVPGHGVKTFEGQCSGTINTAPVGDNGFGYDPVFIPKGQERTFAQMRPKEKKKYSHRGKAMQLFLAHLNDISYPSTCC